MFAVSQTSHYIKNVFTENASLIAQGFFRTPQKHTTEEIQLAIAQECLSIPRLAAPQLPAPHLPHLETK
jgi:hypothetical protein